MQRPGHAQFFARRDEELPHAPRPLARGWGQGTIAITVWLIGMWWVGLGYAWEVHTDQQHALLINDDRCWPTEGMRTSSATPSASRPGRMRWSGRGRRATARRPGGCGRRPAGSELWFGGGCCRRCVCGSGMRVCGLPLLTFNYTYTRTCTPLGPPASSARTGA